MFFIRFFFHHSLPPPSLCLPHIVPEHKVLIFVSIPIHVHAIHGLGVQCLAPLSAQIDQCAVHVPAHEHEVQQ